MTQTTAKVHFSILLEICAEPRQVQYSIHDICLLQTKTECMLNVKRQSTSLQELPV